ncbi:MAG: thiol-disulfide oxidoreductase DCC family protein [Burkholderiales bacterium]
MTDVVVFDGVCNLCTRSVRFILAHEAQPVLMFASLQSPAGARLLRESGFDPGTVGTFVLVSDGSCHVKSDAALRVARFLRMPWRALAALRIVPRPLRDGVYDAVARNRYRWFGRTDACMVPSASVSGRFLHE